MTGNLKPGDGGLIQRPGLMSSHMPKVRRVMGGNPTPNVNAAAVEADPDALAKPIGDLTAAIRRMVPRVLSCELKQLDANGQATGQYRVPFQSLSFLSESSATLTVTSSAPGAGAPGPGPGTGRVPAGAFVVLNLSGYVWTIYGGNPGDLVTVQAFALPQIPHTAGGAIDGGGA